MSEHIIESIFRFLPEIALTLTLVAAVIADLILRERNRNVAWVVLSGLFITTILVLMQKGWSVSIFSDMVAVDPFALFFKMLLLIAGLFIVLFSMKSKELEHNKTRIGEYYMLLVGVLLGMFLMVGATHLLLMYLAFELTSISAYVLAGFTKSFRKSAEASMKYIVFGSVSSGFLIYGISLLMGVTGATDIYGVREALQAGIEQTAAFYVAVVMMLVGFSYKITVVPFHFWAPDVYQGAPVTITTFLATASKIAGFAMMIRFFRVTLAPAGSGLAEGAAGSTEMAGYGAINTALSSGGLNSSADLMVQASAAAGTAAEGWSGVPGLSSLNLIIGLIAALTMLSANLMALWQENIKRLLAYSSVGHAGFILMGLALMSDEATSAMMIYLAIYLFMNMGAFYVVMLVADKLGTEQIDDYQGLGHRAPFLGVSMAIFLVALAGFPPTAGFIAKVYIFGATISGGWIWLAGIAGVASIISLFYYIRVVRNMFLVEPAADAGPLAMERNAMVLLVLLMIPVLVLGIYFSPLVNWAKNAVMIFGM